MNHVVAKLSTRNQLLCLAVGVPATYPAIRAEQAQFSGATPGNTSAPGTVSAVSDRLDRIV